MTTVAPARKSGRPEAESARVLAMNRVFRWLDRLALLAMVAGAGLLFQPWWKPGFSGGFSLLLISTAAQIITAHLPRGRKAP